MAFYKADPRVPKYPHALPPLPPLPPHTHHYGYCDCATRLLANANKAKPRSSVERLAAYDPTHTTTLRNQFVSDMNKRWRRVRGLIRAAVVDQDCLGLANPAPVDPAPVGYAAGDLPGRQAFAFERSGDKVALFRNWLDRMVDANIFENAALPGRGLSHQPTGATAWWGDRYIQTAYQKGIASSRRDLLSAGYPMGENPLGSKALAAAFNHPIHIDRAGLIYARTYEQLRGITNQMSTQISQVLAQGIMDGRGPRDIARLLNKAISGIGGTLELTDTLGRFIPAERRAVILARTEVIRAHHLAGVAEMRSWGAVGVSVQAEFRTAGDDRVCEECAALHGQYFTLDEIEGMIPVHPQCRCKAYPVRADAVPADEVVDENTVDPVSARFENPAHREQYQQKLAQYREYFNTLPVDQIYTLSDMEVAETDEIRALREQIHAYLRENVAPTFFTDTEMGNENNPLTAWQESTNSHAALTWKQVAAALDPGASFIFVDPTNASTYEAVKALLRDYPQMHAQYVEEHLNLYAFNQAYMQARGIKSVTLYRGMHGEVANSIRINAQRAAADQMHRTTFTLAESSLTGYTDSLVTAKEFADDLLWRREVPAADDWIRAGRLRKAANAGDAQAAAALTQMENAILYTEVAND